MLTKKAASQKALADHLVSTLYSQQLLFGAQRQSDEENEIINGYWAMPKTERARTWWFIYFRYNAPQWLSILKEFRFVHYTKERQEIKRGKALEEARENKRKPQ